MFNAFPEIASYDNAFRPDHVSHNVKAARKPHCPYGNGNNREFEKFNVRVKRKRSRKTEHRGIRGITYSHILRERILRHEKGFVKISENNQSNQRNEKQQREQIQFEMLAGVCFENVPSELPSVGRQSRRGVRFGTLRSFYHSCNKAFFSHFNLFFAKPELRY